MSFPIDLYPLEKEFIIKKINAANNVGATKKPLQNVAALL